MQHLQRIKSLMKSIFQTPTAVELAVIELAEAKRELLSSQTALDYSKHMVNYHTDRIIRLSEYVENVTVFEVAK